MVMCLPRAGAVRRSFVEQTVIVIPSLLCLVAAYQAHIIGRQGVRPVERRARNGDAGGTRKVQEGPIAAAIEETLVEKPLPIRLARQSIESRYVNVLSSGAAYPC